MIKSACNGFVRLRAIIMILIGLILLILSLYLGAAATSHAPVVQASGGAATSALSASSVAATSWQTGRCYRTFLDLLASVGIAFVGFGIFGILLDTRSWRDYFGERLKEIVLEQKFLDTMDIDALRALQVRVMKAFFRDQSIDKEGSFLNYFQTNLHRFISEPYREDVTAEIELTKTEGDTLHIMDRVSYTCRKAGSTIQKEAAWRPDPGEFIGIDFLKIIVKFPYNHHRRGQEETLYETRDGNKDGKNLKDEPVIVSLDKYRDIDQLTVIVESKYRISAERVQYWQMAHPTKNFTFIVTYPSGNSIQLKPLVLEPENVLVSQKDLSTTVKCDSWMLPLSGLAWRFKKA